MNGLLPLLCALYVVLTVYAVYRWWLFSEYRQEYPYNVAVTSLWLVLTSGLVLYSLTVVH